MKKTINFTGNELNPLQFALKFSFLSMLKLFFSFRRDGLQAILKKEEVRIIIIHFGGIGDFFLMTPMIKHLKNQIRNVHIAILTNRKQIVQYLNANKFIVDDVGYLDLYRCSKSQFLKFCFGLKKYKTDIFIIPFNNLDQNTLLMGFLGQAKIVISHGKCGTCQNLWTHLLDVAIPLKEKTYEAAQFLALAEYIVQAPSEQRNLLIEMSADIEMNVRDKLLSMGIDWSNSLLVQFSASYANVTYKDWSALNFAKVLDALIETDKINIVVVGTSEEKQRAEEVSSLMRNKFTNLVGATNFTEFLVCIKNAKMVFCLDSAAAHIASAFHTPCIALFGPTDIWAFGGKSHVITNPMECQPCVSFVNRTPVIDDVHHCLHRNCLTGIKVETVLCKIRDQWAR